MWACLHIIAQISSHHVSLQCRDEAIFLFHVSQQNAHIYQELIQFLDLLHGQNIFLCSISLQFSLRYSTLELLNIALCLLSTLCKRILVITDTKEIIFFSPKSCSRTLLLALHGQVVPGAKAESDSQAVVFVYSVPLSVYLMSDNLLVLACTYLTCHPLTANVVHFAAQFERIRISWYQRNQSALIKVNCPTFLELCGFRSRT